MLRKRILPAFVALCMVIALLPVSAFAVDSEPTLQEQIDRAEGSATIQLTENTTESITIPDGKTITLDLNGKTLTNEAGKHTITVEQGGTLTVQGNGTVDNVSHGKGAVYNDVGATCTLLGGTYTRSQENGQSDSDNGGNSWYAIKNFGTMTIGSEGGSNDAVSVSFNGRYSSLVANGWQNGATAGEPGKEPAHTADAVLTIHSGTFEGGINTIKNDDYGQLTITGGSFKNMSQYAVMNWNVAEISGGTFESDSWAVVNCGNSENAMDLGQLKITGGSFTGKIGSVGRTTDADNPVISGGTFSSDVSAFVTEGMMQHENGSVVELSANNAAAEIAGVYYATLPDAVEAVPDGGTVTMLRNVSGAGIATFANEASGTKVKNFTIDFGGYTYTCTGPAVGSAGTESQVFHLEWAGKDVENVNVTLKNGTITAAPTAQSGVAMIIQNYCNLTLENLVVDGSNLLSTDYTVSNNCGEVVIKDTTIIEPSAGGFAFDACDYSIYTGVTVTVEGESYIQGDFELTNPNGGDNNAKIVINGGYFTMNPSAYLAKDKAAVESDKAGYTYMVTDANTDAPAEVAPAAPEADVNPDLTGENKDAAETIQSGLENAVDTVTGDGLTAAAGTVAQKNEVTAETTVEDGKTVLEKLQDLPAVDDSITADKVTIVIQPYMNIAIQDVNVADGNKTLKLEITPMYKTVATTADKAEDIKEGENAVEVGDPQTMTITKPVTVTIPLPTDFIADGTSNVFVEHTKDGRFVAYHAAAVDSGKLTFTNDKGFSEFAVLVDSASASVQFKDKDNEDIGAAASYDLSNVGDTLPTTEAPSGKYFAGWSFAGVDGTYTTLTEELLRALAEQGGTITATPVFRSNGGSVSTNYKITLADTANGTVKASHTSASKGVKVTLTMTPEAYYTVSSVKVTDANGNTVMVSGSGNSYSFTMPAAAVTVTVTFAETECPSDAFIDIDTNKWYHEALDYVINAELMNGVGGNYFNPDGALNRAMLVTMLWRLEGEPAVNYALSFTDVPAESWYTEAVRWAASEGIVDGMTATTFAPVNAITRQQMATMLYRYAEYKNYDTTQGGMELREFKDYDQIADWALTAMTWAVNAGLMEGRGNSMLVPEGEATRAEVAKVLMMFCEDIAK